MKKIILIAIFGLVLFGCEDTEYLSRVPTDVMVEEEVWKDPRVVLTVLVDIMDRMPYWTTGNGSWGGSFDPTQVCELNEAFGSDEGWYSNFTNTSFPYNRWGLWNYDLMREINLFIEKSRSS